MCVCALLQNARLLSKMTKACIQNDKAFISLSVCLLPPTSSSFCWGSGSGAGAGAASVPCASMESSSLSSRRVLLPGQQGISFSRYISTSTAIGTGSWRSKETTKDNYAPLAERQRSANSEGSPRLEWRFKLCYKKSRDKMVLVNGTKQNILSLSLEAWNSSFWTLLFC